MMNARLGVTTCDKCSKLMRKNQKTIIIAEGEIATSNDFLDFRGSTVRYACHAKCWDGFEEID